MVSDDTAPTFVDPDETITPDKKEEKGTQLAGTTLMIGSINAQATDVNNPSAAPTVQSQAYGTSEMDGKIIVKAAKNAGMGT